MCCQLEIQKDLKSYDFLVIAGGDIIEIIKSNNEKIKFLFGCLIPSACRARIRLYFPFSISN